MILVKNPYLFGLLVLSVEFCVNSFVLKKFETEQDLISFVVFFSLAGLLSALVLRQRTDRSYNVKFIGTYFIVITVIGLSALPNVQFTGFWFLMLLGTLLIGAVFAYILFSLAQWLTLRDLAVNKNKSHE